MSWFNNGDIAGTDHPCYTDPNTGETISAEWNYDYGYPFGYWNNGERYEFSVGDAYCTHLTAFGKIVEEKVEDMFREDAIAQCDYIVDRIEDLISDIKKYKMYYNDDEDTLVDGIDGSYTIEINDVCDDIAYEVSYMSEDTIREKIMQAIQDMDCEDSETMYAELYDLWINENDFDFTTQEGLDNVFQNFNLSWEDEFTDGYGMGRIWPNLELITFYDSEQPEPDRFREILIELSKNDNVDLSVDEMLAFNIIFYDYDNEAKVTCCTVQQYINGEYGENVEQDQRTYGDGNTKFVPHLANQKDKKEFYKDFQNTRNQKWSERLRPFNGNMAAYRAARYPYQESKERKQTVRLTESELRRMISEAVSEAMRQLL